MMVSSMSSNRFVTTKSLFKESLSLNSKKFVIVISSLALTFLLVTDPILLVGQ